MDCPTPCDPASDVKDLQNWVDKYTIELKDKTQQLDALKKLLGEIDGSVEQYAAAYEALTESKSDAACFQTKQQNAVEADLDERTRAEIKECIDKIDDEIASKAKAVKEAEKQLQYAKDHQWNMEKGEGGLEQALASFNRDKVRAANLSAAFSKELKLIEQKILDANCDFSRIYYLLSEYDHVLGPLCKQIVRSDEYRDQLYRAWCDVRDAQQKVTAAKVAVKEKEKAFQSATDELAQVTADRDKAIMDCISSIPTCGQAQDPDQAQMESQMLMQSQTAR